MEKEQKSKIKIGITCGDPAGIGPETIVKLFADTRLLQEATFIVYCPKESINAWKKRFTLDELPIQEITTASSAITGKLNIINLKTNGEIKEGVPSQESGRIALLALEKSAEDLKSKGIEAVVTAPVSKQHVALNKEGFKGHTDYYNDLFQQEGALMVLCSDRLKVALATSHVALKDVPEITTKELVFTSIQKLNSMLIKDFGVVKPKIAVLGLNPHAGESGNLGMEEIEVISPAISQAKNAGVLTFGPYAADGFFGSNQWANFDAVLAMYHDQGLTGFKAISFDQGVNFTGGLTVVRTSPGHGTAFEIAGKGEASESSLRNAVFMAMDFVKNRRNHLQISSNPLPYSKQQKESEGAQ